MKTLAQISLIRWISNGSTSLKGNDAVSSQSKFPCIILTGFLGSGKTTLLNALLQHPEYQDAAILVNEFGETSIDHDLIVYSEDRLVVLAGGCVCCSLREDVEGALRKLFSDRDSGKIPPFSKVVIETTGLADPVPLLQTLHSYGLARERLCPPKVVTTVDPNLVNQTLENHEQAKRQVAAAQILVVTKSDLCGLMVAENALKTVRELNPCAEAFISSNTQGSADKLLSVLRDNSQQVPRNIDDILSSLEKAVNSFTKFTQHHEMKAFPVFLDDSVDWTVFGVWMTLLLHRHGHKILRVKGLLNVSGMAGPVSLQSAQHLVHPPEHISEWPSDDKRSRVVFIVDGISPDEIIHSMRSFMKIGERSVDIPQSSYLPAAGGTTVRGRPIRRPTAPSWIKG